MQTPQNKGEARAYHSPWIDKPFGQFLDLFMKDKYTPLTLPHPTSNTIAPSEPSKRRVNRAS